MDDENKLIKDVTAAEQMEAVQDIEKEIEWEKKYSEKYWLTLYPILKK